MAPAEHIEALLATGVSCRILIEARRTPAPTDREIKRHPRCRAKGPRQSMPGWDSAPEVLTPDMAEELILLQM